MSNRSHITHQLPMEQHFKKKKKNNKKTLLPKTLCSSKCWGMRQCKQNIQLYSSNQGPRVRPLCVSCRRDSPVCSVGHGHLTVLQASTARQFEMWEGTQKSLPKDKRMEFNHVIYKNLETSQQQVRTALTYLMLQQEPCGNSSRQPVQLASIQFPHRRSGESQELTRTARNH